MVLFRHVQLCVKKATCCERETTDLFGKMFATWCEIFHSIKYEMRSSSLHDSSYYQRDFYFNRLPVTHSVNVASMLSRLVQPTLHLFLCFSSSCEARREDCVISDNATTKMFEHYRGVRDCLLYLLHQPNWGWAASISFQIKLQQRHV